jgi:hypothetical protein
MRWTAPSCGIERAARHAGRFRRFDSDSGGECGHLLINKKILSNSPFGKTTQTVVAFHLHELAAQGGVSPFSYFKKTAGQAHKVQVPSCQCVRLPRFLLGQPKRPNNRQQDQKGCMGGGGGAPRAPSNRGKSLESWCVENTVLLRAGRSYKTGKLLIAGKRPVDELPP